MSRGIDKEHGVARLEVLGLVGWVASGGVP